MTTTDLSLRLVDRNPVATADRQTAAGVDLESGLGLSISSETDSSDNDDEADLVALPAQLEAIGALLSTRWRRVGAAYALARARQRSGMIE